MIVGSLALILAAAGLLLGGLVVVSDSLLAGSIVSSLLAAVLLYLANRQRAAVSADDSESSDWDADSVGSGAGRLHGSDDHADAIEFRYPATPGTPHENAVPPMAPGPGVSGSSYPRAEPTPERPKHHAPEQPETTDDWVGGGADQDDPSDEPAIQRRPARVAASVAHLDSDVLVVDGRPRYHLKGCVHLLGRSAEPLPVSEANELGFSPCALCEPDAVLASGAASTTY